MLLTITNTRKPASDLSYLLHKHPSKLQEIEIAAGKAHIFYPEVSEERCTAALLLDIDPVGLVRKSSVGGSEFLLEQYVNDRPYVASSFMSAAIVKAFSTAMNKRCKDKPELVDVAMPLEVKIAVLPVRGGETLLRNLFEPLGYGVECRQHLIDETFPDWGMSRYYTVTLKHTLPLYQLLTHLYVLIPVCDSAKHYWVGEQEVEKLLEKGKGWLETHPARELIATRYLKYQKRLSARAIDILLKDDPDAETIEEESAPKPRVHDLRLEAVKEELLKTGATRVVDMGCGEGKLLRLLLREKQFESIAGMDISYRSLEIAREKLKVDRLPAAQQQRLQLLHGSLLYRDTRLEGFDAVAMVEVIEHLDESRLAAMERVVFEFNRPGTVVLTTPNAEYNVKFGDMQEGQMRHSDHRFEWTRQQFQEWAGAVAVAHNYTVHFKPVGEEDPVVGALTQMAVFKRVDQSLASS